MARLPSTRRIVSVTEVPIGWAFYCQHADYRGPGDFDHVLFGNAPILVNRNDGTLIRALGDSFTPALADYRMGRTELATFAPRGMAFKRDQVPLKGNWERLNQNMLDWPQKAPGPLEQKAEEVKGALSKAVGLD